MKKGWVLLTIILIWTCGVKAYSDKKVILLAGRVTQKDTIGYNIVADMARYMYTWLQKDTVTLWDSPEKKYPINYSDLQGIERSTRTSFNDIANLFIYETWSSGGKKTRCLLKGISFAGANDKGEEVLYGYVEYNATLKYLLAAAPLAVNANGAYGKTLLQALQNKEYDFDIIYFDRNVIQDFNKSQKIKQGTFSEKKKLSGKSRVREIRLVEYSIGNTAANAADRSADLCKVLENFFNQNKQEFFNYGGDNILSYLKQSPVMVSKIHVIEKWERDRNGLMQTPVHIVPFVLGIPMLPIPLEKAEAWGIQFEDMPFTEVLIKKQFTYTIHKINNTNVRPGNELIKEALLFKEWNELLQIAKK